MKKIVKRGLALTLVFCIVLLCPRPWLWESHVWGVDIPIGFPLESASIQVWYATQGQPGSFAVFPIGPGLLVDLGIVLGVFLILNNLRMWPWHRCESVR